jgi:hypothetical protein
MGCSFTRLRRSYVVAVMALPLAALAWAGPALAQQQPLRFEVRAWPDAAVLGTAVVGNLVPELFKARLPHARCGPCDPSGLLGIDRGTVGVLRPLPAQLSDAALFGGLLAGAALTWRSRRGEASETRQDDLVVLAEALAITGAATGWIKVLARRPRPFLFTDSAAHYWEPDAGLSFPSGHASVAFAGAAAYASMLHRRGVSEGRGTEVALLFSAAAVTGGLRVIAHKHFPTDVVAGALLGAAIGWVVPRVHATR